MLLNAASINKIIENSDHKNSTKITVQQFIRSLYSKTKSLDFLPKDLTKEVAELFSKATASQFSNKSKFELSKFLLKERTIKINLITAVAVFISGILSLFDMPEKWILPSILFGAGASWFVTNYTFQRRESHSNIASQYLQHDYDLATMQSEFEEVLNKFPDKYKVVFVIDELDKLPNQVDFVSSIKMLINQSSARYIFVSDPSVLSAITVPKSKESTLFSQYLFLKHPTFDEMDGFLNEIIGDTDFDTGDSDFEIFKKFLLFESRSHFFSLYGVIRDHVRKTTSDGDPVLEFEIEQSMTIKANLQKSIEWIYDRRKSPNNSEWKENNTLLTHLYSMAHELTITPIGTSFTAEPTSVKLGGGIPIGSTVATRTACSDFLRFLVSQGYLKSIPENTYSTIGEFKKFNSKPGGIFIEEQQIFVKRYEELLELAINFANIFNNYYNEAGIVFNLDNIHSKWDDAQNITGHIPFNSYVVYRDMYLNIRKDSSAYYTSSDLQSKILELQNLSLELQKSLLPIISQVLSNQMPHASHSIHGHINTSPILNSIGIPHRPYNHFVIDFTSIKPPLIIDRVVFMINLDLDFPRLIINSSLQKTLVIFLSKKPLSALSVPLSVAELKQALKARESSNYYLKMKIPIDLSEFNNLISVLTDLST